MGSLFLYSDPFIQKDSIAHREDYLLDTLTDEERSDESKIHAILLKFAVSNGLVITQPNDLLSADPSLENNPAENMGSWIWAMNWTNMRALTHKPDLVRLMSSLTSGAEALPVNLVIDLHFRLGCLFDSRILNTMSHRVMTSIQLIPYPIPQDGETVRWEDIHTQYPYIWLLILIQAIMRVQVDKIS